MLMFIRINTDKADLHRLYKVIPVIVTLVNLIHINKLTEHIVSASGFPDVLIDEDLNNNVSRRPVSTRMSFSSPKRGATVSFHNISYSVKMKSGFICKRKITQKNILIELKQWKSVSSPASSSDTKNMTGIERQDCSTGEDFLSEQGIDYSTWGLWQNHLALGIMTLLFIAYVKLHFIKKFT